MFLCVLLWSEVEFNIPLTFLQHTKARSMSRYVSELMTVHGNSYFKSPEGGQRKLQHHNKQRCNLETLFIFITDQVSQLDTFEKDQRHHTADDIMHAILKRLARVSEHDRRYVI